MRDIPACPATVSAGGGLQRRLSLRDVVIALGVIFLAILFGCLLGVYGLDAIAQNLGER